MHRNPGLSNSFILLTALAVVATGAIAPHAGAGRPGHSAKSPPKVVTVEIRNFTFEPASVTVRPGDTVEWKNDDLVPHTATAAGEAQTPVFDSGYIQSGASWRYVARKKGTYDYTCLLHPNMKGKLIVQ